MMDSFLFRAYMETEYVIPELDLSLRINSSYSGLDKYAPCVFITAWNPASESLPVEENKKRNEELENDIKGYEYYRAEGRSGSWKEESFFVKNMKCDTAAALMKRYSQNAFLFCDKGKAVELVIVSKSINC